MKKKFKFESLIWAMFALVCAILVHFYAPKTLLGQSGKYLFAFAFIINLCASFNIKVPYISDKKRLPKNYPIYAGIITFILYLSYRIFFSE